MCDSSPQIEKLYNYALPRAYDYTSEFNLMILWVYLGFYDPTSNHNDHMLHNISIEEQSSDEKKSIQRNVPTRRWLQ